MQQEHQDGGEIEATVESVLSLDEITMRIPAKSMAWYVPAIAFFRLPSTVLTARNSGYLTLALPRR